MTNYVEGMTLEQTEAINGESPLIIVRAGAGTGKTRVLINRARRLNSLGRNVLMTTFTRASRKEIEERLASFTEDEFSGGTSVHTLNALAWRLAGCPVLTSYNEKLRLMKNLVEKHKNIYALSPHIDENEGKLDEQEVYATEWLRMVDRLHANDVFGYHEEIENEEIRNLLVEWDTICEENKIIDETTIFKYARLNVGIDPTTRIWDDILIDESQDLSLIQYNFIIQLASGKKLFMVGDPDQSIYAFRAAIPGFMTDMFEYGGFQRNDIQFLSLTLNYRCTNQILKPAINCINSIEYRSSPKILIAQKDGDPLRVIKSVNEKTEAKYIVDRIEALISAGIPYEEIAILSRRHRSLNATISELSKRHIPYIQMGSAFMEREEVKNIQALINLLINPDDVSAAQIVLNVFYKKKDKMPEIFESGSAYAEMIQIVGNKGKNKDITHKLDALNQMVDERIPCEVILNRIYSWFELKDKWQNKKEYRFLFHSLNDLLDMAKNCSTLQELAMALEIRRFEMEGASKSENAIFVGTIFSSKGLEFQHIFIPGVFLGAFPSMHAMDIEESTVDQRYNPLFSGDIDEEKRLLYVGITRAMKSCTITWPTKTGNGSYAKPKMMSPLLYSLKVNLPR